MALCLKCGQELVCNDCGLSSEVGSIEQSCAHMKGAVWVQVLNDQEEGVEGVTVTCLALFGNA